MQKMRSSFLLETEIIQKSGTEPNHTIRCRCFYLHIILIYKVFVTEKGIFRSCGEIKGVTFKNGSVLMIFCKKWMKIQKKE